MMRKQAYGFQTVMVDDLVTGVDVSTKPYKIHVKNSAVPLYTHSVIVATGADSRWLDVPGEYDFRGKGISSCATCDGFLYKGRDVIVVGGGDTGTFKFKNLKLLISSSLYNSCVVIIVVMIF